MKSPILQRIASVYFWVMLFSVSSIFFLAALLIWLVTMPFDHKRRILHAYNCYWSDVTFALNPLWKVRITGRDKIARGKPCVMVANHQSGADIMVLFGLHVPFKWVAKQGLFVIPFIGWNMYLSRYIPIERSQGRSKLRMMDRAAKALQEGNSVMMFPEGTRSPDGRIHPFKSGAFRLAFETQCDVQPIMVHGTARAVKKGGFLIYPNRRIRVAVLDPIPCSSFKEGTIRDLTHLCEQRIRGAWEEEEKRNPGPGEAASS